MKFAQILLNKAHWIFEAEERPEFAPSIVLVDITDKPEVQEGWDYNQETGNFKEPFNESELVDGLTPSDDEILDAQIELKVVNTLLELGVI